MSRIGKKAIPIPRGIKISVSGQTVQVEGPDGKLSWTHRPEVTVRVDAAANAVLVERSSQDRLARSLHGLTRSIIANMIQGCLNGYSKSLEIYGVGYGVQAQGPKIALSIGMSHPVLFDLPAGLKVEVKVPQARGETEPARFTVSGPDKQLVGEFAARFRRARPPEPYKGKGVRYVGERVRRKVGKAFTGTAGG